MTKDVTYRLFGIPVTVTNKLDDGTAVLADTGLIAVARDLAPSVTLLSERYAEYDEQAIRVVTVPIIITAMARAYTRGHGFDDGGEPNEEVAALITAAAARFRGNPRQVSMAQTTGLFTLDMRTYFTGWTLAELFVLNRYRKRAMLAAAKAQEPLSPMGRKASDPEFRTFSGAYVVQAHQAAPKNYL